MRDNGHSIEWKTKNKRNNNPIEYIAIEIEFSNTIRWIDVYIDNRMSNRISESEECIIFEQSEQIYLRMFRFHYDISNEVIIKEEFSMDKL